MFAGIILSLLLLPSAVSFQPPIPVKQNAISRCYNSNVASGTDSHEQQQSTASVSTTGQQNVPNNRFLIHWKGEFENGFSKQFRHIEFKSSLAALSDTVDETAVLLDFENALEYIGDEMVSNVSLADYNEAMQYVVMPNEEQISKPMLIEAASRCSLVHALYEVVAEDFGGEYEKLSNAAIENGGFEDMYEGGIGESTSWCFRVRSYGDSILNKDAVQGKQVRYGHRARSIQKEREALEAMKDLLIKFGGKVDLRHPDCYVYLFDGLKDKKRILTKRIADGPKTSPINPNTRICVTNTPLAPVAAYCLCNMAQVGSNRRKVLDPYAGSCTTLLAAAMISSDVETVGIEIAHNGFVNRNNIVLDFKTRDLTQPKALIYGDSTDADIRKVAREAVGGSPFDCIIADPPYGIRETMGHNEKSPLEELFSSISKDREAGERLLALNGRLVAFVPVSEGERLEELLPSKELTDMAGLSYILSYEQLLNSKLSRWLVSYVCHR